MRRYKYPYEHLYRVLLHVFLGYSVILTTALGQTATDWALEAPANSVQLISADQESQPGVVKFTFKNISRKTIIGFLVANAEGAMTGIAPLASAPGVAPDGVLIAVFGAQELLERNRVLRVKAVVYEDGSRVGSPEVLAMVEQEMLGAALELKRDSALLAASPDPSINGFDNVVAKIGRRPPTTDREAAGSLRGIKLPGVSPAYIDKHLDRPRVGLRIGLNRARSAILRDIDNVRSTDAAFAARGGARQRHVLQLRPHALADLAAKYSSISDSQSRYVRAWQERPNEN